MIDPLNGCGAVAKVRPAFPAPVHPWSQKMNLDLYYAGESAASRYTNKRTASVSRNRRFALLACSIRLISLFHQIWPWRRFCIVRHDAQKFWRNASTTFNPASILILFAGIHVAERRNHLRRFFVVHEPQ